MSMTESNHLSAAERNWRIVRERLCDRIRQQTLALARLAGDASSVHARMADPASITDAERLLALVEESDRRLDRAFAARARRIAETTREPERRDAAVREFKSH